MRYLFTLITVLVFNSFTTYKSMSNEDLVIKPTIKLGHTYVYYLKNNRKDIEDDDIQSIDSNTNYSYFIVDGKYDDKYKMMFKKAEMSNTNSKSDDAIDLASDLDLEDICYETDINGSIIGVLGWDTLSVIIRKKASDLIDSKTLDEKTLKNTMLRVMSKKILDFVTSSSGFVDYYLTDAKNLHLGMGLIDSDIGKEFTEDLFVFQFGLVIPAVSIIEKAEDAEKGKIELIKTTKIDNNELKKWMSQVFSLFVNDEEELEELLESIELTVNKEIRIIYSESSGIPLLIETNYEIVSQFSHSKNKIIENRRLEFKELLID
ncbi:MAG: hypothetical protein WC121_06045 [Candidatus Kapaibacterium sp.]